MCCLVTILLLLGPRMGILFWWLLDPLRWAWTFNSFIWPILGFLFLPWTTLMFVLTAPGGVNAFDFFLLALAFLVDVGFYGGGAYGNRGRVRR